MSPPFSGSTPHKPAKRQIRHAGEPVGRRRHIAGRQAAWRSRPDPAPQYPPYVDNADDVYERLRPPPPTPASELCSCSSETPVKIMSTALMGFNPIHCLECNLEVPPERLGFGQELANAIADWLRTYGPIDALELQSGEYEEWARAELMNPDSPPNREALKLARRLNKLVPTYFWFWQPQGDDDWQPASWCPVCGGVLAPHDSGLFPQLLCEQDRVVVVASS